MIRPLRLIVRDPTLRMIVALIFLFGAINSAVAPYAALLAIETFGLPEAAWSVIMVVGALVMVTSSIATGIVTDQRNGRRATSILLVVISAAGAATVWLIDTPQAFIAAHAVLLPAAGGFFGLLFAMARLAASRADASHRDEIVAAVRAIFALAFVVTLPAWSAAFAQGADLRMIYPVNAALSLFILVLLIFAWPPGADAALDAPPSGLHALQALAEIATARVLVRIALLATITAANVLYMSMMGLLFSAAPGRDFSDAALFLTFVTGMEVPFMLAMGALVRRLGQVRVITWGGVYYAVFLAVFVLSISHWVIWILSIAAAFGAALILTVPISYMQDLLAHRPGAGASLLAVNQVSAFAIAAGLFSLSNLVGSYTNVGLIGAAMALAASLALAAIERRANKT